MNKVAIGTGIYAAIGVLLAAFVVASLRRNWLTYWQTITIFLALFLPTGFLYAWIALEAPFWAALLVTAGIGGLALLRFRSEASNRGKSPFPKRPDH